MTNKVYKLNLFQLLAKLDKKDFHLWNMYSDEEKKEIAPLVIMRWLTGNPDKRQIVFLNEIVNKLVFPLADHKELLLKLLAAANTGVTKKYYWLSVKSSAQEKSGSKNAMNVIQQYYECSPREAAMYLRMLSKDDVLEMCEHLGLQREEIQLVKKEF